MAIKNKATGLSTALKLLSLMSLLIVMSEKNTNSTTQLNIVYSKPNIGFLFFFSPYEIFKFTQDSSAPLMHTNQIQILLCCVKVELELPDLKLLKLPQDVRVAILFPSA